MSKYALFRKKNPKTIDFVENFQNKKKISPSDINACLRNISRTKKPENVSKKEDFVM